MAERIPPRVLGRVALFLGLVTGRDTSLRSRSFNREGGFSFEAAAIKIPSQRMFQEPQYPVPELSSLPSTRPSLGRPQEIILYLGATSGWSSRLRSSIHDCYTVTARSSSLGMPSRMASSGWNATLLASFEMHCMHQLRIVAASWATLSGCSPRLTSRVRASSGSRVHPPFTADLAAKMPRRPPRCHGSKGCSTVSTGYAVHLTGSVNAKALCRRCLLQRLNGDPTWIEACKDTSGIPRPALCVLS